MSNQQHEEYDIKKIIALFDKFSISLMSLIKRLISQKIVSLDSILMMLPKKNREKVLRDCTTVKPEKKRGRGLS